MTRHHWRALHMAIYNVLDIGDERPCFELISDSVIPEDMVAMNDLFGVSQ